MSQHYSNPDRESDPHALPDVEVFQLTAHEVAERDEELIAEYLKRSEFRLATMNGKTREKMLDAMIEENGIEGGWFYWYCFPGCMPDSDPIGPYTTRADAVNGAQSDAAD